MGIKVQKQFNYIASSRLINVFKKENPIKTRDFIKEVCEWRYDGNKKLSSEQLRKFSKEALDEFRNKGLIYAISEHIYDTENGLNTELEKIALYIWEAVDGKFIENIDIDNMMYTEDLTEDDWILSEKDMDEIASIVIKGGQASKYLVSKEEIEDCICEEKGELEANINLYFGLYKEDPFQYCEYDEQWFTDNDFVDD